jgi:hypothetical protein
MPKTIAKNASYCKRSLSPNKPKKRSPKEIIEADAKKEPHKEHAYFQVKGDEIIPITKSATDDEVIYDQAKIEQIIAAFPKINLRDIHTHLTCQEGYVIFAATPSKEDIKDFLSEEYSRDMIIFQQNDKTNEVEGLTWLKKRKKVKKLGVIQFLDFIKYEFIQKNLEKPIPAFKEIAKKYNLQYKFVPAKGYKLAKNGIEYVKKKEYKNQNNAENKKKDKR